MRLGIQKMLLGAQQNASWLLSILKGSLVFQKDPWYSNKVLGIQKTAASNRYVRALERLKQILDEVTDEQS